MKRIIPSLIAIALATVSPAIGQQLSKPAMLNENNIAVNPNYFNHQISPRTLNLLLADIIASVCTTDDPSKCPLNSSPSRSVTLGSSDAATTSDGTIAIALASPATFVETLPQCASGNQGQIITVKDELGQASSYTITVQAAGSPTHSTVDTIPGATGFSIIFNFASIGFQCDSSISGGNWMAE